MHARGCWQRGSEKGLEKLRPELSPRHRSDLRRRVLFTFCLSAQLNHQSSFHLLMGVLVLSVLNFLRT